MNDQQSPNEAVQDRIWNAIELTKDENYDGAIGTFEELLPTLGQGTIQDRRVAAAAFSYYGLCIAMVKRRYSKGIECCKISLNASPMEPAHRYNLAMIYMERDDRKGAVEALGAGLRINPRDRRINKLLDRLGRRRPPVISFLHRNNLLNIYLGKLLRSKKKGS